MMQKEKMLRPSPPPSVAVCGLELWTEGEGVSHWSQNKDTAQVEGLRSILQMRWKKYGLNANKGRQTGD